MKLLQFSSIFFITVTIHSYYINNYLYHHLSLFITISSILFHNNENKNNLISYIDKFLAKFTYHNI
jgi:hypothetical protein